MNKNNGKKKRFPDKETEVFRLVAGHRFELWTCGL